MLRDDIGENISLENCYYGELTALYWIWKNTDSDYIGFYHYNKKLDISDEKALDMLMSGYDMIVSTRDYMPDHAKEDEYELFVKTLQEYDVDFYTTYRELISENGSGIVSGKNMFITGRNVLNAYCEFLFPLLQKVRVRIGDVDSTPYYKRYCAFFAERLLTVWIIHNKLNYYEVNVKMQGPINFKIALKLHGVLKKVFPNRIMRKFDWMIRRSGYKR